MHEHSGSYGVGGSAVLKPHSVPDGQGGKVVVG